MELPSLLIHPTYIVFSPLNSTSNRVSQLQATPHMPTQARLADVPFYCNCARETSGTAGFILFLGLQTRVPPTPDDSQ